MNQINKLLPLTIITLLSSCTQNQVRTQYETDIVGTWEWTRNVNNCHESYTFKTDGTDKA